LGGVWGELRPVVHRRVVFPGTVGIAGEQGAAGAGIHGVGRRRGDLVPYAIIVTGSISIATVYMVVRGDRQVLRDEWGQFVPARLVEFVRPHQPRRVAADERVVLGRAQGAGRPDGQLGPLPQAVVGEVIVAPCPIGLTLEECSACPFVHGLGDGRGDV